MMVKCLLCGKEFSAIPSRISIGKGVFCSRMCYAKNKKGQPFKGKRYDATGRKLTKEHRQSLIDANKRRVWSKESREKASKSALGRKLSVESRMKMSANRRKGADHPSWKGGVTPINEKIRKSLEYVLWREAVFTRDKYTCVWCGDSRGGNLQADHIKPFAYYPELRFAIDNGRTLCKKCHKTTDTYGAKAHKFSTDTTI